MTAGKGREAREAEPETDRRTGKVLFAEKKKEKRLPATKYGVGTCVRRICTDVQGIFLTPKHTELSPCSRCVRLNVQVCLEFCGKVGYME